MDESSQEDAASRGQHAQATFGLFALFVPNHVVVGVAGSAKWSKVKVSLSLHRGSTICSVCTVGRSDEDWEKWVSAKVQCRTVPTGLKMQLKAVPVPVPVLCLCLVVA